ncbi:MAG: ABC transporter substrate-binding protein [Candidatus Limnocylindrales bacterium]
MSTSTKATVAAIALLVLTAVSGCSSQSSQAPSSATASAPLTVGTAVTAPFEYYNSSQQLVGFDIDLMNEIGTLLHRKVTYQVGQFSALVPDLQAHKVNAVIAAMYITPAREQVVSFATPYLQTGLVMVERPGLDIHSAADLKGLKVGVKSGATGQAYLNTHQTGAQAVVYSDTLSSFHDLVAGRIDVVLNDYLNTLAFLKDTHSNVTIVGGDQTPIYLQQNQLGIAVSKDETGLLSQINGALATLKNNGFIKSDFSKWLGTLSSGSAAPAAGSAAPAAGSAAP